MNSTCSVEIDFILNALSFFIQPETGLHNALIQKLNAITNWDAVINLAARHRILPFITLALDKANALMQVPTLIRNGMIADLQQAVLDNMAKMKEFKKCNRLFEEAGIPVIPLKGVSQTQTIYREIPVRRMGDIDILIQKNDLKKSIRLLETNGFCFLNTLSNRWQREVLVGVLGRSSYVKGDLDIDLQWQPRFRIGPTYAELNLQDAWKNSTPCPDLGTNVFLLSAKHEAQHLLLEITADFDRGYLIFFQLVGLALLMHKCNLPAEDILNVGEGLKLDAKKKIEIILRTVYKKLIEVDKTGVQSQDMDDLVREIFESDLDPEAKMVWNTKMILEAPISWPAKTVYFAGYFLPRPGYVRQKYGLGFMNRVKGYIGHWSRLIGKAYYFFIRKD